ncbi:hypothetical protein AB0M11_20230 [Streptomyces sp. NPDC051987]|uniref:hypothetical protein n=1 Tax=Streptomyces sp. NPDC051987 TaxID=3155808 RepID=UPI0034429B7C
MSTERELPAVAPAVTAELVAALSPRLRKRLDAGIAKLADRPVVRDGNAVRITVDDEGSVLELDARGGVVADAAAIRCGCLLAPDCLHRAAAASAAPVADVTVGPEGAEAAVTTAGAGTTEGAGHTAPAHTTAPSPTVEPTTAVTTSTAAEPTTAVTPTAAEPAESTPPVAPSATPAPTAPTEAGPSQLSRSSDHPSQQLSAQPSPVPVGRTVPAPGESATPPQASAAQAVFGAVAAVLDAGTDGSGAVLQAELLRAAHTARLAGLPRAAGAAVSVVTALRAARAADPAFRLTELVGAVSEALFVAYRVPFATGAELVGLRGTARQPYTPDGSLRLYGLFSEPVLTASGYAGAVTWTADAEGRLYSVSDVAPGGAGRAVGAADRAVRVGDTALTHRELARAGLAVSGATVSPAGRLGAGAGVRAVRASGVDWRDEPLDRLWAVPAAEQVGRALAGGRDLLFLEVTPVGAVREAAGDCLLADCGGVPLRLTAAHDHPAFPYRDNLRLLAAARGSRLRVIARLTAAPHARAQLLAAGHPTIAGSHVDLGLDRLRLADLPAPAPVSGPVDDVLAPEEATLHLLRRRVGQAASGGRRVLAFPGDSAADARRLRRHGLGTAGDVLDELLAAAADRSRDAFGRLLPADTGRFARAWLTAARYTDEVDRLLCAAAWDG